MQKIKTGKLALDAMLSAMCAVLGYLALDTGNVKLTFESLPILLGALLFGPADGACIGLVGTTIYQLARYGVSVTTPLWILPYVLTGLLVGTAARRRTPNSAALTALILGAELLITLCNTATLYLDSRLFGYYYIGLILGSLTLRLALCVGKGLIFSVLLGQLLHALTHREGGSHDI